MMYTDVNIASKIFFEFVRKHAMNIILRRKNIINTQAEGII